MGPPANFVRLGRYVMCDVIVLNFTVQNDFYIVRLWDSSDFVQIPPPVYHCENRLLIYLCC